MNRTMERDEPPQSQAPSASEPTGRSSRMRVVTDVRGM